MRLKWPALTYLGVVAVAAVIAAAVLIGNWLFMAVLVVLLVVLVLVLIPGIRRPR